MRPAIECTAGALSPDWRTTLTCAARWSLGGRRSAGHNALKCTFTLLTTRYPMVQLRELQWSLTRQSTTVLASADFIEEEGCTRGCKAMVSRGVVGASPSSGGMGTRSTGAPQGRSSTVTPACSDGGAETDAGVLTGGAAAPAHHQPVTGRLVYKMVQSFLWELTGKVVHQCCDNQAVAAMANHFTSRGLELMQQMQQSALSTRSPQCWSTQWWDPGCMGVDSSDSS
ncbi:hypothetical protein CYMTET_54392 [Cymbomonas tetramitiformis]|uniref:Uncharacterized protein n=1 Tax=Cymbomonas tetramitiformis TaxID=36881 RepID=A0AAE0BGE1_9CHLO|nr:hypothetical protein CYMTET_54392 [Cymbomonas tetramitiformis]